MDKLRTFLETMKKMPERGGVLSAGVVIPSSFSEGEVTEMGRIVDESGIRRFAFTSREDLERVVAEAKSPVLCLIPEVQFNTIALSGLIDLVFQFS